MIGPFIPFLLFRLAALLSLSFYSLQLPLPIARTCPASTDLLSFLFHLLYITVLAPYTSHSYFVAAHCLHPHLGFHFTSLFSLFLPATLKLILAYFYSYSVCAPHCALYRIYNSYSRQNFSPLRFYFHTHPFHS